MTRKLEISTLIWITLALTFLTISFRERIGTVYIGLVVTNAIILFGLVKRKIYLNSISGNTIKSILIAFGAYIVLFIAYYFASFLLQGFTAVAEPSWAQMISYMQTQSVLVLEKSKLLEIFAVGILIPVIETPLFFGSLFEFISQQTKTSMERLNARLWVVILVISGMFTWFHVSVRGVSNVAWFITFIFGIISCVLVIKTREVETAVWLHILNNTINKLKGG